MTITCPCGHSYAVTVRDAVTIEWCAACGTGATVPPPQRDVYGDGLFEDDGAGYGGQRVANRAQWIYEADRRLQWLGRRLAVGARILEIGAATGEFVARAEQLGYAVVGLETSPLAAREAATLTDHVHNVDLAGWRDEHPDERFDAAVMFHVVEHLPSPRAFLSELQDVLSPGGLVFAEVPNGASRDAHRSGASWWAARTEDHFFHFSPAGFRAMLTAAGYQPLEVHAVHRDVYSDHPMSVRARIRLKDAIRPLLGKGGRSLDLLRVVASRP